MNKNNLPIYFSLAVIFGVLIGSFFNGDASGFTSFSSNAKNELKIKKLLNYIQRDYVDTVNTDKLLDGAIAQMLNKLDPHSVYIPKENLQAITENMQGNFVGIGVQFRMIKDSITVIQPIQGGPSIKAGIKAGDRILMADNDTLFGKEISSGSVPKFLKGKPETKVTLQIYRKSTDSLFTVSITRGKVNIKSVDLAYMINDNLGYIKLDRFARNTYREFKTSLQALKTKGMTNLILDLRGNGGGFIDIANRIVDEFLEDKKRIVFTKNNKNEITESFATENGIFEDGGVYVLMDENSASASEILAGALQDNDKGTIVGRRSFGKGLVQQEMDLGDGSAVRLTIARYYTPTGRSIQKPYSRNGDDAYASDFQQRVRSGELSNKDSIPVVDSLRYTTPKGKIVYGGGGIIPDVFVPIDTTSYMNNFYFIAITNFAFEYVDRNRRQIAEKWTLETFISDFDSDARVYDKFYAKIKEFNPSIKTQKILQKYLKSSIANEIFGDVGFYRMQHKNDKMILKVLELENQQE